MEKKDLKELFRDKIDLMDIALRVGKSSTNHPVEKGDNAEKVWTEWLTSCLPERYQIAKKAKVIDYNGNISDEIDAIICDRQYSYLVFKYENTQYIPAESVYAVIEVKQTFDKNNLEYAGNKIASVRQLKRTSVPVTTINGESRAKPLHKILGGIFAYQSGWSKEETLEENLMKLNKEQQIDFGCALKDISFWAEYSPYLKLSKSAENEALMFLFFTLLMHLQAIGTVPAIDIPAYAKSLKSFNP